MTSWAQHERAAALSALAEVGPDAPTLCEGWRARDLAAHLYVRERRPDAALGVLPLGPVSAYTDRVMASALRVHGYDELIDRLREAPTWVRALKLDEAVNTIEFLVHTEDVRRANDLPRRRLPDELEVVVWQRLRRQARLLFRRSAVRVRLRPTVDGTVEVGPKDAAETVELRGRPSELLLFGFNRKDAAEVEIVGTDAGAAALRDSHLGL